MLWMFIGIPAAIWCALRLTLPNQRWEFDFDVTHATFFLLADRYIGMARFVVAADLIGSLVGWHYHVQTKTVECCLVAALYGFMFSVWMISTYETYLQSKYLSDGRMGESSYTTSQFATTRTLGYSTIIFSMMGISLLVLG